METTGPEPGTLLTPSIRLVRPLGAGAMGSVWVAEHLTLATQVVVKFIASEAAANPDLVARFTREAAAAAQVKSPHVVQMLDHGITPRGVPYIVMELLEGSELGKYFTQRGMLLPPEVAAIVTQICKALRRAHERRIVHRDIKPQNIFMCDVGGNELFIKVLDFGIAKKVEADITESGTRTGAMIGTPYYMSPEQLVGAKDIDFRSDLWSLGVVAFQLLTGRLPFLADNMGALVISIHSGVVPLPSQVNPALSPAIDAWFVRACSRDPNGRFQSAQEMAEGLHAAVHSVRLPGSVPNQPVASSASGPQPAVTLQMTSQPFSGPNSSQSGVSRESTSLAGFGATTAGGSAVRNTQPNNKALLGVVTGLVGLAMLCGALVLAKVWYDKRAASHAPTLATTQSSSSAAMPAPPPPSTADAPPPTVEPAAASAPAAATSVAADARGGGGGGNGGNGGGGGGGGGQQHPGVLPVPLPAPTVSGRALPAPPAPPPGPAPTPSTTTARPRASATPVKKNTDFDRQ